MSIQPINYAGMPLLDSPWDKDFGEILKRGMQLGQEPGRLARAREQEELSNLLGQQKSQMQAAEIPYAGDMAKANLAYKLAQAERERAMAAYGGMQFPGGSGMVQGREALKRIYGENSPQVKWAEQADDLLLNQRKSGIGRLHAEIEDITDQLNSSYLPESKRKELQSRRNQLENKAFQEQSDISVRDKGLAATQLEQTWDAFEEGGGINALKKYTGLNGTFRYFNDLKNYLKNNQSNPDFDALLVAREQLHIFADQYMRAFPGSSGYERMKSVYENTDPSSFLMPPGALEAKIRGKWATLKPELGTIKEVLTGKNPLRETEKTKQENVNVVKKEADAYRKNNPKPIQKNQDKQKALYWNGSDFVEGGC